MVKLMSITKEKIEIRKELDEIKIVNNKYEEQIFEL